MKQPPRWRRRLQAALRWLGLGQKAAPAPAPASETAHSHRMMALALQAQGQLDMAFERLRQLPLTDAVLGQLQHLALDFERKGHTQQAQAVYRHMGRPAAAQPLPGRIALKAMIGPFQVIRQLGKGAMAVVYLCKDPDTGTKLAVKTLALSQEFDGHALADVRERFFREAQAAGRLRHPNIVSIIAAAEDPPVAYIAMEYLRGQDLLAFCAPDKWLPVPNVLSVVARVADALAYAHAQQVVHRDIKPANIMYDPDTDTVKVTDFGIARITDVSKTKTGLVLGTPSFMSPEQLAGKKVDGRSDLYSLGVLLYQMLTGVLPFRATSLAALMHNIAHQPAPDVRTVRPDLPESVAHIVARALEKHPQTRYQSGDQFAADLRAVLAAWSGSIQSP